MKICCFTWNIHGTNILPQIEESADITILSLQESLFEPKEEHKFQNKNKLKFSSSLFGLKTIVLSNQKLQVDFYKIGRL